jgi:two-component system, OmpR family, sensor histidine kinase CiaH
MPGLRRSVHTAPDPDATALRRVATRLALLTVGLMLALLVGIVVTVYLTTHALMLGSLQDTVRTEAQRQVSHLKEALRTDDGNTQEDGAIEIESGSSGVIISFADRNLKVLGSSSTQFRGVLPDRASAAIVVKQAAPRFSSQPIGADSYLIYSVPVLEQGHVEGVVQATSSMRQYDDDMRAVLLVLLSVGGVSLLALAAIATLVVGRALVPIRRSLQRQRDFVADAAHELRTPLTILHSAVELGLAANSPEDQEDALTQALVESRHLARLIGDLSLLARADSGALALDTQPVELSQLVSETVNGVEMLAEDQGVRLDTHMIGDVRVLGDPGRLRQLLVIVLDNALKHTPPGGAIRVALAEVGGKAQLQVQDTGPGIEPQDLPRLFDRLYRAKRDRGTDGGGLGLAIARWIAEAHGGRIVAANASPHGAVFTVTLPILAPAHHQSPRLGTA